MHSVLDHQTSRDIGPATAQPAVTEPSAVDEQPATSVSWHLSPGYATHLHAYELAMLPCDERALLAQARRGFR